MLVIVDYIPMQGEFEMPEHVEYPDLSGIPDDATFEEKVKLVLGRPIRRNGVDITLDLNITDEMLEAILADAGIELDDEDYVEADVE